MAARGGTGPAPRARRGSAPRAGAARRRTRAPRRDQLVDTAVVEQPERGEVGAEPSAKPTPEASATEARKAAHVAASGGTTRSNTTAPAAPGHTPGQERERRPPDPRRQPPGLQVDGTVEVDDHVAGAHPLGQLDSPKAPVPAIRPWVRNEKVTSVASSQPPTRPPPATATAMRMRAQVAEHRVGHHPRGRGHPVGRPPPEAAAATSHKGPFFALPPPHAPGGGGPPPPPTAAARPPAVGRGVGSARPPPPPTGGPLRSTTATSGRRWR